VDVAPPLGGGVAEHLPQQPPNPLPSKIKDRRTHFLTRHDASPHEIEDRHSGAFAQIGPGTICHFKHLIGNFEAFLDPLADPEMRPLGKLMDYAKTGNDVAEFCWFYMR